MKNGDKPAYPTDVDMCERKTISIGSFLTVFTRWMVSQPAEVRKVAMKGLRGDNYMDEQQRKVCSAFKTELRYQAKNNKN